LAQFAGASNSFEAEAAELAARRLMEAYKLDPVTIPNKPFNSDMRFGDNALLKKLRDEYRAAHPNYYYSKPDWCGNVRRLKHKPRPKKPEPVNHRMFDGMFDDFKRSIGIADEPEPPSI
jgi:hypothetical protein